MVLELTQRGVHVESQKPLEVFYKAQLVGDYKIDLFVEQEIIVELKSVANICAEHEVQLVNYLNAIGKEFGLLINFGPSVEVKRKYRLFKPKK